MIRLTRSNQIHIVLVTMLSFLLHALVINQFVFWLSTDTDGYWLHAATFVGRDWSMVARNMPSYYSWGYSLLLTIPMLITDVVTRMYKIAVLINALLLCLIVPMTYDIGRRLFPKVGHGILLSGAFLASMYTTYILECGVSLAECLIYFLVFLIFWAFVRYLDSENALWGVLATLAAGYAYIVHNRNLGIVLAFGIAIFVSCVREKRVKHLLLFLGVMLLVFGVKLTVDNWLSVREMADAVYTTNTYESVGERLTDGFSLYSIYSLLQRTFGEVWYTLAGTMLLAGVGVAAVMFGKRDGKFAVPLLYSVLSWIMSIGVSAVFLMRKTARMGGRIDTLIHGRYMECTAGILLVFGIYYLSELKAEKNTRRMLGLIAGSFALAVLLSVAVYIFSLPDNPAKCNWFSVVAVLVPLRPSDMRVSIPMASLILIGAGLVGLLLFVQRKRAVALVGLAVFCGMFFYVGYTATNVVSTAYREAKLLVNTPLYNPYFQDVCGYLSDESVDTLYVYAKDGYEAFSYQLVNPDCHIVGVTEEDELAGLSSDVPVLVRKSDRFASVEIEAVHENELYYLGYVRERLE